MLFVRFIFGLGEGLFPACAFKTVAGWFPKRERATANAIMLSSNSLGAALAPLTVVAILSFWDWRAVFYILFFPGILVSALFWIFIRDKPSESRRVTREELNELQNDETVLHQEIKVKESILEIIKKPNVLKFFFVLFTFDITNWGFVTWLPSYLVNARGFSMAAMGVATSLPFFAGTAGYIVGGVVSDKYFSKNRRIPIAATQLICALLLYLMFIADSLAVLIVCQTLAGFFLKVFFSAFWALPMNTVPERLMGITSGFINMAGQIAAFVSPLAIGYLVGAAGGKFDLTFMFLILSALVSCALVFTLPGKALLNDDGTIRA